MVKEQLIQQLTQMKTRLCGEVSEAYQTKGNSYGQQRFEAWTREISRFLTANLPQQVTRLEKLIDDPLPLPFTIGHASADYECFWRDYGENCESFIDSLIVDIRNDEHSFNEPPNLSKTGSDIHQDLDSVFIVHGHNDAIKEKVARFVEKLDLKAVILHEQTSGGKTIIEKIEACTNVGFAIVLYTPDDVGRAKTDLPDNLQERARQNVIFEHGYLIGKLGRSRVIPLVKGDIEMPSDVSGIVYVTSDNWEISIAKEMRAAGYQIDLNRL